MKVRLPRDWRIQYRFVVDGDTSVNDTDALVPNQFGGDNSVGATH